MSTATDIHNELANAWNKRDMDRIRSLYHADYAYTGPDGKEMTGGPDVGVSISEMYAKGFPDGVLTVKHVYTQGNTAIAELVGRGTHGGNFLGFPATGRKCEVTICNVMQLRDGKIYREHEYMDMLTILTQLGVVTLPEQAATSRGRSV